MSEGDDLRRETGALRERLTRLSEAILSVNASLDFDSVLQRAVDNARTLAGARHGALAILDDSGQMERFVTSGFTPEERREADTSEGLELFEYLGRMKRPMRVGDLAGYAKSLGYAGKPAYLKTFLGTPIRYQDQHVGYFYLANKGEAGEFTLEDEETLAMFASHAATAIANARSYGEERRAKAELEALVRTSPVGILVVDAKTGDFLLWNSEAKRIVDGLHIPERNLGQLHSMTSYKSADGGEIPSSESPLRRAGRGETTRAEEIFICLPDGREVPVLVSATPIYSEDGEVVSLVSVTQDLTPLEELERLRAGFLGMVSHELRTPLAAIRGSATTLLDASSDLDPAEVRQFHRIIVQQSDLMRELISDLLDMAQIETGTLSVNPEPSDVATLVDRARSSFLGGGARHELSIILPTNLPPIMSDRRRISQVLSNLLSNAARHSSESSTIEVTAAREEFHVAVTVVDQGRGVSAARLPHLFRKFARVEGYGDGREVNGTGLGLIICKGIVEAHGGRIWAESEGEGLGTRFTFTLPIAAEDEIVGKALQPLPRVRAPRSEAEGARILAVDDDPRALRHVRKILSGAGYVPIVTADHEEALRLMRTERPRLVLLDLVLPGTDGLELMQRILDIADVPVILLSAYGREENIERAFEMGADDYLVKPFSPTELVARIRATLRRWSGPDGIEPAEPFVQGDLTIEYSERYVTIAGEAVELTATEYNLLFELSSNAGRVLHHDQLLRRVWGPDHKGDSQPLRTFVKKLRQKLGDDANRPRYIFTVPRVGYHMRKPGAVARDLVD